MSCTRCFYISCCHLYFLKKWIFFRKKQQRKVRDLVYIIWLDKMSQTRHINGGLKNMKLCFALGSSSRLVLDFFTFVYVNSIQCQLDLLSISFSHMHLLTINHLFFCSLSANFNISIFTYWIVKGLSYKIRPSWLISINALRERGQHRD